VNKVTRELMALFGATAAEAAMIQKNMELSGVDFSECSPAEFRRAARRAAAELGFNFQTIKVVSLSKTFRFPATQQERRAGMAAFRTKLLDVHLRLAADPRLGGRDRAYQRELAAAIEAAQRKFGEVKEEAK
jgi:hypothetical protein